MKDRKLFFGIALTFVFLASISFSYAYFSSTIVNKAVKDQVVTTGTLSLRYVDGAEINMQNIKPGTTITKTFYVVNTGTLNAEYNLVWQELLNEITKDEMLIEGTCTRINGTTEEVDGTCEGIDSTPVASNKIKKKVSIEPNIVHKYDLTITFKDTDEEQNYNQGKNFNGVLGVEEYTEPGPIYCNFDGEMVDGAEYSRGQFTYRYKQQSGFNSNGAMTWISLSDDGWGVQLTDKNSTAAITSDVCTYINDKPVVSYFRMLESSSATSVDFSDFYTKEVAYYGRMFSYTNFDTVDLSEFDTSGATNFQGMFNQAYIKKIIGLDKFDTSNVTNMSHMFSYTFNLSEIDVSHFDTSKVTSMTRMFYWTNITELDLSNFNFDKVSSTNMSNMLYLTDNLKTIYVKDEATKEKLINNSGVDSTVNFVIKSN